MDMALAAIASLFGKAKALELANRTEYKRNQATNHYRSIMAAEPSYDKNDNDDFGSEVVGATVRHIQQVTSLIEERLVGLAEIAAMLDKILRQHSIDSAVKLPYAAF